MKEEHLTADVSPDSKNHSQPQNHELDSPQHRPDSRPVGALQIHQHQHRAEQEKKIQNDAGNSQTKHPMACHCVADGNNQIIAKQNYQPDGH